MAYYVVQNKLNNYSFILLKICDGGIPGVVVKATDQ